MGVRTSLRVAPWHQAVAWQRGARLQSQPVSLSSAHRLHCVTLGLLLTVCLSFLVYRLSQSPGDGAGIEEHYVQKHLQQSLACAKGARMLLRTTTGVPFMITDS